MATAVPSRFAVLALDNDHDDERPNVKETERSLTKIKTSPKDERGSKQKLLLQQQQQNKKDKNKNKKTKQKKKDVNNDGQQWEQWKQKDTQAVEEAFKQELHEAILLSKLAYESQEKNDNVKDADVSKKLSRKKSKKATMSLEEFNNLMSVTPDSITTCHHQMNQKSAKYNNKALDGKFFQSIEKETEEEITKSEERDMLEKRSNSFDKHMKGVKFEIEIEKRDKQIEELKNQIETLRKEVSQVKEKNKKLQQVLACGEMKDKASVWGEVVKLQTIRDELISQVVSLHAQLEQERSRSRGLESEVKSSKHTSKRKPAEEEV